MGSRELIVNCGEVLFGVVPLAFTYCDFASEGTVAVVCKRDLTVVYCVVGCTGRSGIMGVAVLCFCGSGCGLICAPAPEGEGSSVKGYSGAYSHRCVDRALGSIIVNSVRNNLRGIFSVGGEIMEGAAKR